MSENSTLYLFMQLIDALYYMQCKALLAHRDLNPDNLLVDQNFDIKITDFGFSTKIFIEKKLKTHFDQKGTTGYMAPEIIDLPNQS